MVRFEAGDQVLKPLSHCFALADVCLLVLPTQPLLFLSLLSVLGLLLPNFLLLHLFLGVDIVLDSLVLASSIHRKSVHFAPAIEGLGATLNLRVETEIWNHRSIVDLLGDMVHFHPLDILRRDFVWDIMQGDYRVAIGVFNRNFLALR